MFILILRVQSEYLDASTNIKSLLQKVNNKFTVV